MPRVDAGTAPGRRRHAGVGAAQSFVDAMEEAVHRHGWRLQACVLMRNHFHLVLETPEPNLTGGHALAAQYCCNAFQSVPPRTWPLVPRQVSGVADRGYGRNGARRGLRHRPVRTRNLTLPEAPPMRHWHPQACSESSTSPGSTSTLPPHEIVAMGLDQCPEGRMVFANLKVMQNLRSEAYLRRDMKAFPVTYRSGQVVSHIT